MKLWNYHTGFQLGELRNNLFRFILLQIRKMRPEHAFTKTISSVVAEAGSELWFSGL